MDNIILLDKDNKEVEFKILKTFGVDDKDYAALEPIGEDYIVILEMVKKNDEIEFYFIEDQDELDEVIEIFEQLERE
jgi:hypothetical protein